MIVLLKSIPRPEQDNLYNIFHQIPLIFVESLTPSRQFTFQTGSTIPISTQIVTESSRYFSRNQEHNSGRYERSQRVDRAVIESRMTHTVNRNPRVYKTSRGTSQIYTFLDWRDLVRRTEFFVESTVIL